MHLESYSSSSSFEDRSPALFIAIRTFSSPCDLRLVGEAFRFAMQLGGDDAELLKRPTGQSYNPRPARIASILLSEVAVKDPRVLAIAMLATTTKSSNKEAFSEDLQVFLNEAEVAIRQYPECDHFEANYIFEALLLDSWRQLHRRDVASTELAELQAKTKLLAARNDSRLAQLVLAAQERYLRRKAP
jgi:hypothetical protein